MAFDGITIANIVSDMQQLAGGRIAKIVQPEKDELLLTVNTAAGAKKLLISAGASLPLFYFTEKPRQTPMAAPAFCMLLRKHIGNGRILSLCQPGLERVIRIEIEHADEMGDLVKKYLITELMGRHSNIILTDSEDTVIDSIKRIPAHVSSVREVLPGRRYFIPDELKKKDPLCETPEAFAEAVISSGRGAADSLVGIYSGVSPAVASEICYRAGIDADSPADKGGAERLWESFCGLIDTVRRGDFTPNIVFKNNAPIEFASIPLSVYDGCERRVFEDASSMLEFYYEEKETRERIRQKSSDLRKTVDTVLAREVKKADIQEKQLSDTKKADRFRLFGELLTAYAHELNDGADSVILSDYNDGGREVKVPLDPALTIRANAAKYYEKYQKLRRTKAAVTEQLARTRESIDELLMTAKWIDASQTTEDLDEIRKELSDAGYVKKQQPGAKKQKRAAGVPLHFVSADGFDIYVGKNNTQNEYVTFKMAGPEDWWFHAKGRPGSHVIVKADGCELTDAAFEEAAALAARYSSAGEGEKVEVDYTKRKNLKKPQGGAAGFVTYHVYFSIVAKA